MMINNKLEIVKPILLGLKGQKIWNLRCSTGSILLFEVGDKIILPTKKGEREAGIYSFCVYCTWRIVKPHHIWVDSSSLDFEKKLLLFEQQTIQDIFISDIGDIKIFLDSSCVEIFATLFEDTNWNTNWDVLHNNHYYTLNDKLEIEIEAREQKG